MLQLHLGVGVQNKKDNVLWLQKTIEHVGYLVWLKTEVYKGY